MRFELWWGHATRHGLCYSFECVTPGVLGDHGATPRAAYVVLTAISVTAEERCALPPPPPRVLARVSQSVDFTLRCSVIARSTSRTVDSTDSTL